MPQTLLFNSNTEIVFNLTEQSYKIVFFKNLKIS
jgi:hypothetical protein